VAAKELQWTPERMEREIAGTINTLRLPQ